MAYFIFGYFSTKLGTSVSGQEKITRVSIEIAQEISGSEPIFVFW
jgi:hypothetical protein